MAVAYVPLARLSHQSLNATTASLPVWVTAPGAVGGFVVAWRKPGNPVGWLLLAATAVSMLTDDAAYYAVADYRLHHGGLPLGWVALLAQPGGLLGLVLFGLVFLLFPRRQAAVITVGAIIGHHPQVDSSGQLFLISGDDPAAHSWNEALTAIFLLVAVCLVASLAGQVASWRHSSGERRQQLKWLAAGTAALVTGIAIDTVPGTAPIGTALFPAGLIALSLCMGVAVLRYRLFDIDRVVSRTLADAIVTGLLVGVYAGIVLLATQVLQIHSAVAVAVATLAAAAMFSPLRRRVQNTVDRRSTGPATTPTRSSPGSRPGCEVRSTWTPCGPTWPVPCSRRWSPPTSRYGSGRARSRVT